MRQTSSALLIPCYNAVRYLQNLRKQVDALKPAFDELVIVDDGSTDDTVEKARALGFDIRPLGTNRGPGAARNAAAKFATADWIHFLDADDEIEPDYLARVLPSTGDDVDVVLAAAEYVDEEERAQVMLWDYPHDEFLSNPLRAAIVYPVLLHASLMRRHSFCEIGGFDERHRCWEDGDVHVRLAASGARFRTIHDVLARSLRHRRGTSGSDLYCHRCRLEFLESYEAYVPRIPRQDLLGEVLLNARNLVLEGDDANAGRALDLAMRLGWHGPESKHPVLAVMGKIPSKRLRKQLFARQVKKRAGVDSRR